MDRKDILRATIRGLEHELLNFHVQSELCRAQIIDAEAPTGNADADMALRTAAVTATNTRVRNARMIGVRAQLLAEAQAELAPLESEERAAAARKAEEHEAQMSEMRARVAAMAAPGAPPAHQPPTSLPIR